MDEWQKAICAQCKKLLICETGVTFAIDDKDAYVIMKALEAQERYDYLLFSSKYRTSGVGNDI